MNTTPDLAPLQAHLDAIKARTLAWVAEDPANRWACYPVDDAAHWAEWGIHTVAEFEHHSLVSQVFEGTRERFGFKPSWAALNSMTDADLKAEVELLSRLANQEREEEEQAKAKEASYIRPEHAPSPGFTIGELVAL